MELVDSDSNGSTRHYYRVQLAGEQGASSIRTLNIREIRKGNRRRVAVLPGQDYRVECTEDFRTWTTVHEGVSVSVKPVDLVDPNAAQSAQRFYRLVFE